MTFLEYSIDFEIWTKILSKMYIFAKIRHELYLFKYQIEVLISHLFIELFRLFFNEKKNIMNSTAENYIN